MSSKRTGPNAPASSELKRKVWDLAMQVRRKAPKDMTTAQAEATITEFKALKANRRRPTGPLPFR